MVKKYLRNIRLDIAYATIFKKIDAYEKIPIHKAIKLEIDNNFIENQIRPVALGRKNWLFSGSHENAQRLAMIYSIIGTCKANGINPMSYFKVMLEKIPDPNYKIEDLLPLKSNSEMFKDIG